MFKANQIIARKFFVLSTIILTFSSWVICQNKPVLLGASTGFGDDPGEFINHSIVEPAEKLFKKDLNGFFAVRICSTAPLPVAFYNDGNDYWQVIKIINERLNFLRTREFINIPESKIYFLRNETGCRISKKIPLIEYWFVPSYADFPAFIEVKKPEDISARNIISSYEYVDKELFENKTLEQFVSLTSESYEETKLKIVKLLREDKTSFLLIRYVITSGTSKNIRLNKAIQLKSFLLSNSIGEHRIFVKECIARCVFDEKSKNSIYPDVAIIYQK